MVCPMGGDRIVIVIDSNCHCHPGALETETQSARATEEISDEWPVVLRSYSVEFGDVVSRFGMRLECYRSSPVRLHIAQLWVPYSRWNSSTSTESTRRVCLLVWSWGQRRCGRTKIDQRELIRAIERSSFTRPHALSVEVRVLGWFLDLGACRLSVSDSGGRFVQTLT